MRKPRLTISIREASALYEWMKHEYIPHDDSYKTIVKALDKFKLFLANK